MQQEPDYSEWKQRQLWTLVEASCLLSGIEPVPPEQFNGNRETGGGPAKIYADLKDAIDLKQLSFVESRDPNIRGRRVRPDECVTWAAERGYVIPDALQDLKKRDPYETPEQRANRLRRRIEEEKGKGNKAPLELDATPAAPDPPPTSVRHAVRKLESQELYKRWRSAYRQSKKKHPDKSDVWHSQQIAKLKIAQGRKADTIRKHMS